MQNRKPVRASAIDIDETGNIRLTIWKKPYLPSIRVGKCYHIHKAVTNFFGGSYQIQATEKTAITELKNETVHAKTEFIRSPALSLLRGLAERRYIYLIEEDL